MSEKKIECFYSLSSPWAYLAYPRLLDIAARHGAEIALRPIKVVPDNGGILLRTRPQPRQDYHALELDRWRIFLGMKLNLKPKFYPTENKPAAFMVIAAKQADKDALSLTRAFQTALWAEERDIFDLDTRLAICAEQGFDGAALHAASLESSVQAEWDQNWDDAIGLGIFGTPNYVYKDEIFWGQDRLDFLDRRLAEDS
jgi:2-hydroxychromene-2-carboxylate isomerase